MSQRFVDTIERFTETEGVDLVTFEKGQRRDDVAQAYLAAFDGDEGVFFVGKAQRRPASSEPNDDVTARKAPSVDHAVDRAGRITISSRSFKPNSG